MATRQIIPIYTSRGDHAAFLLYPYIYNRRGEWIGWVNSQKEVYSVHGRYAGYIAPGPRVMRKRSYSFDKPQVEAPPMPPKIRVPSSVPLPPMMSEPTYSEVDVLDEEPEKLPTMDSGEFREDMD